MNCRCLVVSGRKSDNIACRRFSSIVTVSINLGARLPYHVTTWVSFIFFCSCCRLPSSFVIINTTAKKLTSKDSLNESNAPVSWNAWWQQKQRAISYCCILLSLEETSVLITRGHHDAIGRWIKQQGRHRTCYQSKKKESSDGGSPSSSFRIASCAVSSSSSSSCRVENIKSIMHVMPTSYLPCQREITDKRRPGHRV